MCFRPQRGILCKFTAISASGMGSNSTSTLAKGGYSKGYKPPAAGRRPNAPRWTPAGAMAARRALELAGQAARARELEDERPQEEERVLRDAGARREHRDDVPASPPRLQGLFVFSFCNLTHMKL